MPQFSVYKNKNAATRARFPFLLDIQSDLLDPLATRVNLSRGDFAMALLLGAWRGRRWGQA